MNVRNNIVAHGAVDKWVPLYSRDDTLPPPFSFGFRYEYTRRRGPIELKIIRGEEEQRITLTPDMLNEIFQCGTTPIDKIYVRGLTRPAPSMRFTIRYS